MLTHTHKIFFTPPSPFPYLSLPPYPQIKPKAGGTGDRRLSLASDKARLLQEKVSQTQRFNLFNEGVILRLLQIIALVSAYDSRQVLEDAIQCLCNIIYNERVCLSLLKLESRAIEAWKKGLSVAANKQDVEEELKSSEGADSSGAEGVHFGSAQIKASSSIIQTITTFSRDTNDIEGPLPTMTPLTPVPPVGSTVDAADCEGHSRTSSWVEYEKSPSAVIGGSSGEVDKERRAVVSRGGTILVPTPAGVTGATITTTTTTFINLNESCDSGVSEISSASEASSSPFLLLQSGRTPNTPPLTSISTLLLRLRLDGANCSEVSLKVARCLSTFFFLSSSAAEDAAQQGAARVLLYMLFVHRAYRMGFLLPPPLVLSCTLSPHYALRHLSHPHPHPMLSPTL